MYFATWPPAGSSALFKSSGLKRAGEHLTKSDLEEQYGFMTDTDERMLRQQMQVAGRPLTRAEQRGLTGRSGLGQYHYGPPESSFGSKVMGFVIVLLLLTQLVAYVIKTSHGSRTSYSWNWYDTVLVPSYLIIGLFSFFSWTYH
jgi:hypothetical protein